MEKLGLNGLYSVKNNENITQKNNNVSFCGLSKKDSFEFSTQNPSSKKVKPSLFEKLFSVFGSKSSVIEEQPKVDAVWLNDEGVTESDATSEIANSLRSKTYMKEHPYTGAEYSAKLYSENAIKTVVKYAKQNLELASSLAEMFKYSESRHKDSDFEYLVEKQMNAPELVQKYESRCRHMDDYLYFLQSADLDEELTDILFAEKTPEGYSKFSPIETAIVVQDAQKYGVDLIKKYATEQRIPLYYRDIFALCAQDAEHSEKIEELIDFVDKNGLAKKARISYVSNLLVPYLKDSETTKGLMLAGIMDKGRIEEFSQCYVQAPEHLSTVLEKREQSEFDTLQNYDVVPFALKVQQYEQTIKDLTGSSYKDLSLSQLKKIVSLIEKGSAELKGIMSDN